MKNLKNKIFAGAFALATLGIFGEKNASAQNSNPTYSQNSETQKQETPKEQKLSPDLNFYFETGGYAKYIGSPEFKKYIEARLSDQPKEDKIGQIWFYYGDTDDDGFYDCVSVESSSHPIRSQEKFYFNFDTKEIDYVLDIYEFCPKIITDCDKIISKSYNGINQKESYQIGEDFNDRIKKFLSVQKGFSRFNPESLEKLVREEYEHRLKLVDGKLAGNSRTPLEKFLSEEEIKKVEDYIKGKPERERIKREQEERAKAFKIEQEKMAKVEYENREKIRIEQEERIRIEKEAKKITARLGINGGIAINSEGGHIGPFLGITPKLTNKKGKGFAIGLDIIMMNSKMEFEDYNGVWEKEDAVSNNVYLISKISYTNSVLAKTTNLYGLNTGYVSPAFKIFTSAGFLGRKMQITTITKTEEYTEVYGVKQGTSSFKTEKEDWERIRSFVSGYFGIGMEISPFFKKNSPKKNISLSLDWLITKRGGRNTYPRYNYIYYPSQNIIKAGLKYTFKK